MRGPSNDYRNLLVGDAIDDFQLIDKYSSNKNNNNKKKEEMIHVDPT